MKDQKDHYSTQKFRISRPESNLEKISRASAVFENNQIRRWVELAQQLLDTDRDNGPTPSAA